MKPKKLKNWIFVLIIIMLISNFPPIKSVISLFTDENHYRYSNADGSFTGVDIPFKGRLYNLAPVLPKSFKEKHPTSSDTIVYRLFWKNPLAFWRWGEYYYDKRYNLPYLSWKEIRKKRGYDLKYSTNWQDF
jgi:hypothetical protein